MRLEWRGRRLLQEGVGVAPEQVGGEGEGEREAVEAGGQLDGGDLHVVAVLVGGGGEAGAQQAGQLCRALQHHTQYTLHQTPDTHAELL